MQVAVLESHGDKDCTSQWKNSPPSLLQIISSSSSNAVVQGMQCVSVTIMLLLNNKFSQEGNLNEASDVSLCTEYLNY